MLPPPAATTAGSDKGAGAGAGGGVIAGGAFIRGGIAAIGVGLELDAGDATGMVAGADVAAATLGAADALERPALDEASVATGLLLAGAADTGPDTAAIGGARTALADGGDEREGSETRALVAAVVSVVGTEGG